MPEARRRAVQGVTAACPVRKSASYAHVFTTDRRDDDFCLPLECPPAGDCQPVSHL
nr:hypothetical protein [Pantoea sp. JZ2]